MSCEIPGTGLYSTTGPAATSVRLTTLTPGELAGAVTARTSGRGMTGTLPRCIMPPASMAALMGPCLASTIVSCCITTFRMSFTCTLFFLNAASSGASPTIMAGFLSSNRKLSRMISFSHVSTSASVHVSLKLGILCWRYPLSGAPSLNLFSI
jgi:hypothetical protein